MKHLFMLLLLFPAIMFGVLKSPNSRKPIEGKLLLAGGMYYPNITSLNQYLSTASFPVQELPLYTMGLVYQVLSDAVVSDFEFHWSFNQGQANGSYQVAYRTSIQLFNMGYLLIKSPHFHLYPLVGIGRGAAHLESIQISSPTFTQILTNAVVTFRMDNTGLLFNAGIGMDILIDVNSDKGPVKYFSIGVRGGYLFDYSDDKWDAGGIEVSGGPAKVLEGAYFRVLLGLAL